MTFSQQFKQYMEQFRKQTLLKWLSKVVHDQVQKVQSLRNGIILTSLCNKIPGINLSVQNNVIDDWKQGYKRLKSLLQQLQSLMKTTIKYSFPNTMSTMNLVQLAKGQDDQGLMSILSLVFLISINLGPDNSQVFVNRIMSLQKNYQDQLMEIARENQIPQYDKMQQFQQKYQRQRQKVKDMISMFQNISLQNDSLRQSLISEAEDSKKLSQSLKKSEQQRQRLKRQLIQLYKSRQQQTPSKNLISEHNEQMIEMLKSTMLEQQQKYSQQVFELREKIQGLEEQRDIYRNKVSDLEYNTFQGTVDHNQCVNINTYKKEKNQLTAKLTEASASEWKTKLENIRLQNLMEELKEKNKKLAEQAKNKENTFVCTKNDATKMKLQFYTEIRNSLKRKIQGNGMLNPKKLNQEKQEAIILDDPDLE